MRCDGLYKTDIDFYCGWGMVGHCKALLGFLHALTLPHCYMEGERVCIRHQPFHRSDSIGRIPSFHDWFAGWIDKYKSWSPCRCCRAHSGQRDSSLSRKTKVCLDEPGYEVPRLSGLLETEQMKPLRHPPGGHRVDLDLARYIRISVVISYPPSLYKPDRSNAISKAHRKQKASRCPRLRHRHPETSPTLHQAAAFISTISIAW